MCGLLQQKGDLQAYTPLGTPLLPNGGQKSVFTKALAAKPSPVFDNDSPEGNPPHPSSRSPLPSPPPHPSPTLGSGNVLTRYAKPPMHHESFLWPRGFV